MLRPIILIAVVCSTQFSFGQIQFEQVPPPPPAPQIIADFEGVREGSIAFSDVDGDGDQDVLITGSGLNNRIARLYTNDGSGSYTLVSGTPFEGVENGSIAFADVDGDGDQDVLITGLGLPNRIARLYTNNGSGSYTLVNGTPFEGVSDSSIDFADVDGDGDQDVLITGGNSSGQSIARLYANNGSGGYTLVSGTPFEGVYLGSIAFADVDGDGDQDVLITGFNIISEQRIARLYTNNGSGSYTLVSGTPLERVQNSSIAFADVDGDGDQDVLITGAGTNFQRIARLYTNNGSGGYTFVTGTPFEGVDIGSIAFADVDGDEDLDVLITGRNNSSQLIARLYSNNGSGGYTLVSGAPFEGVQQSSIAFADVDGDGDQDVLITGGGTFALRFARLYTNDGTGSYTLVNSTPFEGVSDSFIAFADVDGDGDQDVLITGFGTTNQRIALLYTNNGSGAYTPVSSTPFEGVQQGSIAFADVDGDGDQDVLITGFGTTSQRIARLYTNDGSGGYTLVSGTPLEGVRYSSIAFADVDGDGDQDVLITGLNSSDQRIARLYTNDGSGGYTLVSGTPFPGVRDSSIAFSDVDGDGDQDVLITGENTIGERIARLYNNNGSGGYTLISGTAFEGVTRGSIAFADVDEDGDQDVLITGIGTTSSIAQLYTNNGSGGYTLVSGTPFEGVDNCSIAFADVNGDGNLDALITGRTISDQTIAKLYTNDGSGCYTLVSGTPFEGVRSSSIAFADVDGDGDPDVLITGLKSSLQRIAKLYRNITPLPCNTNASCTPYTLTLSPSGTATLQPENIGNGSTTTCGTPILTLSQTEFDWRHLGENTVILTVTDENGNTDTCETTVTVQPPVEGFPLVNVVSVPSEIEVDEGESFSLTIRIEPDSLGQVTAANVAMSFDPTLLQVTSLSLSLGSLLNTISEPAAFDNGAGTLFVSGSSDVAASESFDHVVINFQAIGSGTTSIIHITEGPITTALSFAGFDVRGFTPSVSVIINDAGPIDCEGVPNGSATIGTACTTESNLVGIYDGDCNCIPNEPMGAISIVVDWQNACGARSINLKLTVPGTSEILFEFDGTMNAGGTYLSPAVPAGSYDALIKVNGTLAKLIQNVQVGDEEITIETGVLTSGDLNNDNWVNMSDLTALLASFNTDIGNSLYEGIRDLNCDAVVDITDLTLLLPRYEMVGDSCVAP